ncbi:MAG: hypothetical protein LRS46_02360 [Desulfurococcales archaeon]|nr:hypothetical protein [Desulfurococcales archaeon]
MSGEEKREEAREALRIAIGAAAGSSSEGSGRVEELREVRELLGAVSQFLKDLEKPLTELLKSVLELADGEKVGSDVARFYAKLKEAGVPEDMAAQMTREYFERRMSILDVANLLKRLGERWFAEEE